MDVVMKKLKLFAAFIFFVKWYLYKIVQFLCGYVEFVCTAEKLASDIVTSSSIQHSLLFLKKSSNKMELRSSLSLVLECIKMGPIDTIAF